MSAGEAWKRFGHELRPRLEHDAALQHLAHEVLAGLSERLLVLMPLLYARILEFVRTLPQEAVTFWYDDPVLAARYSGAQQAVVPARGDIAQRVADQAWTAIERALQTRPIAYALDLGTGDGIMARTFLARRPDHISRERVIVVASDRSAAMLAAHAATFIEYDILTMDATHGDMRGDTWCTLDPYRARLGTNFEGFDVVMGMMTFHILPNRGTHLYPNIRHILREDGTLVFTHDFFRPGESWATYAPAHTLLDGYNAYVQGTTHPISFLGYLAGFILRRGVLQGDQLCTLQEELEAVEHTFSRVHMEKHARYNEFAVITARS